MLGVSLSNQENMLTNYHNVTVTFSLAFLQHSYSSSLFVTNCFVSDCMKCEYPEPLL